MDIPDIEEKPILIVAATFLECAPTLNQINEGVVSPKLIQSDFSPKLFIGSLLQYPVELLITGIGNVNATFALTRTLTLKTYSVAISIGIAGSFDNNIQLAETVQITEDLFADFGIDDNGKFKTLTEVGLKQDDFDGNFIDNPNPATTNHQKVRGITVQTATGNQNRINELVNRYNPQVETMENAAFFYVCRKMNVPFASFRAISNKVEPRNRKNWKIDEAIESVNSALLLTLKQQI